MGGLGVTHDAGVGRRPAWRRVQQGAASGLVSEPGPGGFVSAMGGLAGVTHDAGVGALAREGCAMMNLHIRVVINR